MQRITIRHTLPPIQTFLFVALFTIGSVNRPYDGLWQEYPRRADAADVAFALNYPALYAAGPVLLIFGADEEPFPAVWVLVTPVYVLWFLIGRWIDCAIGLLPQPPQQMPYPSSLYLNWLGMLGCFSLALLSLYRWLSLPGWFDAPKMRLISLAVWLVYGGVLFGLRLRRWHKQTKQVVSERMLAG